MTKLISKHIIRVLVATILSLPVLTQAQSAFTWNGGSGTTGNWSDAANWGGTGPANPQAFLNFNGAVRTSSTNDFGDGGPGYQIYFKSSANAFNLFGNSIIFYDFGNVDPNIQNEGAFTNQTVNFAITNGNTHLSGGVAIMNVNANGGTAQGPLTFNGPVSSLNSANPRVINVSGSNTVTFNGVFSDFPGGGGTMALTQLGTGTTILAGANAHSGANTLNSGILQINNNAALGFGNLTANTSPNQTKIMLNGVTITNSMTLNVTNPGAAQGVIQGVDNTSSTVSGVVTINTNTISGGHLVGPISTGLLTMAGPINLVAPASSLLVRDGYVRFSGGGSYTNIDIRVRTNSLGANNGISTTAVMDLGGNGSTTVVTAFDLNGFNQTLAGLKNGVTPLNLAWVTNSSATPVTLTLANSGASFFSGSIAGNLALTVSSGTQALSNSSTAGNGLYVYTGDTTVSGGTLKLLAANLTPNGTGKGNMIVNSPGTLDLNTFSQTVNGLSGSGTLDSVAGGTPTLTVGGNNASSTFTGLIKNTAGTLALTKTGSGTLTLSGSVNNTFGGATTIGVNAANTRIGIIRATANQALGTGTITPGPGGNDATARLELTSGVTLNNLISMPQRSANSAAVVNISGNNTLSGTLALTSGGSFAVMQSDAGTLTLGTAAAVAVSNSVTASTRILTLQGASGGNVVGNIIDVGTAVMALTKDGAGTWTLSGANTFSSDTRVTTGTLQLNNTLALQNSSVDMNVADAGTLDLNSLNATLGGLKGGRNLTLGTGTISIGNNNAANTYSGSLSGTAILKVGTGIWTLSSNNTYSGTTTINAGELVGLTGGSLSNSPISVANGATNGVLLALANGQWNCGNLTYSAGTTYADFNFNSIAPSTTTAPLQVNGNLALTVTPNIIIRAGNAVLVPGTYPLIKYTGALSGTPPAAAFSLPAGVTATIVNNTGNKSLDLSVTVGNQLTWTNSTGIWDINTTFNWTNTAGATSKYVDGQAVRFDDASFVGASLNVTNIVTVTPALITVANPTKNIALGGPSIIAGTASIIKSGAGVLSLGGPNTFTGGIALNGGTLNVTNAAGAGTGTITMANGTTLGANTTGAGNVIVTAPILVAAGATVTFNANALGSGSSGTLTSGDASSTINITSSFTPQGNMTGFNGTVNVSSGTTRFNFTGTVQGSAAANWIVNSTAPGIQARNNANTVNLGSLSGSGTLGQAQSTTAANTTTYSVGALNTSTTFSGKFTEGLPSTNCAVTKVGTGTWTVSGNSPHTAATTVNAGTLMGVTGGSFSNSSVVVNTGATNGVSVTIVGSQWVCTNLTYAAGVEYVNFSFGVNTPSTTVAPLLVQNNLTLTGTLHFLINGGSTTIPVGTYPLIKYGSTLTGTPTNAPLTMPQFVSGIITNDTFNKLISLIVTNVSTPPPLVWNIGNGTWDTSSLNWTNFAGTLTAYSDANATLFDDTATGAGPFTVTLNTTVNPTSVTVSNVTKNYTLTGTGNVTGSGSLIKTGAGTLVMATTNSYSGGTVVSGGTLQGDSSTLRGSIVNSAALVFDQSLSGSNSAVISGTGTLTKQNSGTVALGGINTYTGKTFVNAGTLAISAGANVGANPGVATPDQLTLNGGTLLATNGPATITLPVNAGLTVGDNGATVDVASGITLDYPAQAISGGGSLTKNGAGTFQIDEGSASSTYTNLTLNAGTIAFNKSGGGLGAGSLVINSGTLRTTASSSRTPNNPTILVNGDFTLGSPTTAAISFANGGAWTLANGTRTITVDTITATITGVVGDGGNNYGLTKAGSGTLILNNVGTYTGPTTISAGALKLGNNLAAGTTAISAAGTLQIANGIFVSNNFTATQTFESMDVNDAAAIGTYIGTATATGGSANFRFMASGAGATLVFSNATVNTGSKNLWPTRGNIVYAGASVMSSTIASLIGRSVGNAATLLMKDSATGNFTGGFRLGDGGAINSSVALTLQDAASLTTGANVFDFLGATVATSSINLNGGTLATAGFIKTAANAEPLSLNGGTIKANASSATFFPALTGLTASVSTNGAGINDNGFAITISQPLIHDAVMGANADGGLTKSGAGTTTLSGANTYTGNTVVSAGTLAVNGSLASPLVTVNTGATLGGNGIISGVVSNNGTLAPGTSIGTLTLGSSPVLNGALLIELNRTNAQTADLLNVTAPLAFAGSLTVTNLGDALQAGDTFTLFAATSYSGSFSSLTLPALAPTLAWNTANLTNNGTITVVLAGTPPVVASLTPLNPTAQCSSTVNFTVTATGTAPITYQWNTNGTPVSGETATNFFLLNAHFPTPITVSVTLSNGFGVITSNSVVTIIDTIAPALTVLGASPVTNQCHSTYTDAGATALDACAGSVGVSSSSSVDANTPGSYTVTYRADDGSGNTNTATRTVVVIDTTAPVITYNFTNLNLSCGIAMPDVTGTNYIIASDACSAAVTLTQTPTNGASLSLGSNQVILAVSDSNGNVAYSTNSVTVTDTTAPVITLLGANPATNECHVAYTDAGATALDGCSLTVNFSTNNNVNANAPGSYTVIYTADDGNGNTNTMTRTVVVQDTLAPVITVLGANPATNECHFTYTDAGATANDACAGNVSVSNSSTVNANAPGTYTVTYTADDGAGHTNTATRTVVVQDTLAPVITLLGNNPATNECHATYIDAGATANDACAGSVSVSSVSTVNANMPGSYTVTYTADDGAGHTNTATRTVVVQDTLAPVITVLGANPATNECHFTYTDAGATANDACVGNVSVSSSSTVNANMPGSYTVTYTADDGAGHTNTATRTVVVIDTVAPVITVLGANPATNYASVPFVDPGATASDSCAGFVAVSTNGLVDVTTPGTYTLEYVAADPNGNSATNTRTVVVLALVTPVITSEQMLGNGAFAVTFTGPDGQPYTLLASPDVTLPQVNWTTLTNSTFGPSATSYTDLSATNDPIRFYRVRSP